MSELKNCPFCGAAMQVSTLAAFHPRMTGCWLSFAGEHGPIELDASDFESWNTRALSVAPAPVAADARQNISIPDDETVAGWIDKALGRYAGQLHQTRWLLMKFAEWQRLQSPPVQEGPKGFAELPRGLVEDWEAEAELEGVMDTEYVAQKAVEWARQRSPAQSIPAAPCQCKPDDTTGWTDDDIMVPRCNVCGLVVMKVIAERKAEWVPAAIDEEGREALNDGLKCIRLALHLAENHPQFDATEAEMQAMRKHISALERLLSGN